MRKIGYYIVPAILALVIVGVNGCRKEEAETARGKVVTSEAYVEYFGHPPAVAAGSCYGLVGFLPMRDRPGMLRPFPFFLFGEKDRMRRVVEQLIHWGEGWDLEKLAFNPFPEGTKLRSLVLEQGLARLEFEAGLLERTDPDRQRLILNVLGHTLAQFEEVGSIMVLAGEKPFPFQSEGGVVPNPSLIVPPAPPQALAVSGTWEGGEATAKELSVLFDRPVAVEMIEIADPDGRAIEGERFLSIFHMAVVVHPLNRNAVRGGMPVRVAWEVTDLLGRKGKGEETFRLTRVERP